MLFSFGKHKPFVYIHFHNPHSLLIDTSQYSCYTPIQTHTHTATHTHASLLAVSAAVLGPLCLLRIILLKIKVILLSSIFLSLSHANLFPVGPVCR